MSERPSEGLTFSEAHRKVMDRLRYLAHRVYRVVEANGHFYGDEHDILVVLIEAETEFALDTKEEKP